MRERDQPTGCRCGDPECILVQVGYTFCRPCEEHHRGGECPIDEQGRSIGPDGQPW